MNWNDGDKTSPVQIDLSLFNDLPTAEWTPTPADETRNAPGWYIVAALILTVIILWVVVVLAWGVR